MKRRGQYKHGFTIVELLVVIVVIGILAVITIVAYNGVQDRAYNARVLSVVDQYQKGLMAYKASYGAYPTGTGCLGAGYPNNTCWAGAADGTSPQISVNAQLDTDLKEFIPTKPIVSTQLYNIVVAPSYRAGLVYLPNDTTYPLRMSYYLKGNNANCSLKVSAQANEGPLTQCTFMLPN